MAVTGWLPARKLDLKRWYYSTAALDGGAWLRERLGAIQQQALAWQGSAGATYQTGIGLRSYPAGSPGTRFVEVRSARFILAVPPPRAHTVEFTHYINGSAPTGGPKRLYIDNVGFRNAALLPKWRRWSWPLRPWMVQHLWTLNPVWLYRDLGWLQGSVLLNWVGEYFQMRYYYTA